MNYYKECFLKKCSPRNRCQTSETLRSTRRGVSLYEALRTGSDPAWEEVCLFNPICSFYLRVPHHSGAPVHRFPKSCPDKPHVVWLLRSVGSKLKGVTEAIPRRPAGPDALSPEPPGLRVARPQVRGARWEVHSPSVGSNGASLLPDGSHLRALRWGRSRAVRTGPGSPGRRSPPRSPPGRLRPREPLPRPPGPGTPLTRAHGPGCLTRCGAPTPLPQPCRAAERRELRAAAAAAAAPAAAALHPRRVRLQLLLLSLRLLPPLRPAASQPPPPSAPAPARRPRQSPGPRPARVSLPSPQPASRAARARPLARQGLAARLPARRRPPRGSGERQPGSRGGRRPRRGVPLRPRRASPLPRAGGTRVPGGRPCCPRRAALAPKFGPGLGNSGELGSRPLSASQSRGAGLAALPALSAHPHRDTDTLTRHTRSRSPSAES